jgi:AbrB family looped-hinge helix DNA binding protein
VKLSEIVRVDSRGRIIIPSSLRTGLSISEGTYLMLVADLDKKEATIVPFAHPGARLAEFQIGFGDSPGALARAAALLAELGVDLLSSQSRTLRRGELAEWNVIGDISASKVKLDELQKTLENDKSIKSVKIRTLVTPS